MAATPVTVRIDSTVREALENLSKREGRPVDHLLIDAVKQYLGQHAQERHSLEQTLARIADYRVKDPGFKQALAEFIEAEVTLEDTVEGKWMRGRPAELGPVQSKVRELLGAS